MNRFWLVLILLCSHSVSLFAENRSREEGTIVRMRMTDCLAPRHPFMNAMSGAGQIPGELCPEYVLVTDRVVYVISGRSSDQLLPLAETTRFHFQNNEVLIRVDDARHESHFHVKVMVLRPEWDRSQQIEEAEAVAAMEAHRHLEDAALTVNRH
jgi:hypothetical protein